MLQVAFPLSPPCAAAAPGPWQRLGWSETGNAGFPSAGPWGLRTATVFGFEIQMTNTHALFPKEICCIYRITKIPDFEVSHCKVCIVSLLKSLYQEQQTITVAVRNWCVNLLKEVYVSSLKKLCCKSLKTKRCRSQVRLTTCSHTSLSLTVSFLVFCINPISAASLTQQRLSHVGTLSAWRLWYT